MNPTATEALLNQLKETSTRGKIAYCAACFESAIEYLGLDKEQWDFMIEELWSFCYLYMVALWVERMIELLPDCVMKGYNIRDCEYITEKEHNKARALYENADPIILRIIELTLEIGSTNLNTTINTEKLKMLHMPDIEELISLMKTNGIPLPDSRLFEQFPITENHGWGREFTRVHVFGD